MHVSNAGRKMIEAFEGCVLHAYPDTATGDDPWTIGYGCTGPNIRPGLVITQVEADQMLSDRLAREFESGVMAAIGDAPTTQAQFDAMISLAFNIGVGAFKGSTVALMHKAGNTQAAADAFALWNRAGGRTLAALTIRRLAEAKLYLSQPSGIAGDVPMAVSPIEIIKRIQTTLGVVSDGAFGRRSRAAMNAVLVAVGQPGI